MALPFVTRVESRTSGKGRLDDLSRDEAQKNSEQTYENANQRSRG